MIGGSENECDSNKTTHPMINAHEQHCIDSSAFSAITKQIAQVHSLPCRSDFTGPAFMSKYFHFEPFMESNMSLSDESVQKALTRVKLDSQNTNSTNVVSITSENQSKDIIAAQDDKKTDSPSSDSISSKYQARLRGRKLYGVATEAPQGYHGVLLRKEPIRTDSSISAAFDSSSGTPFEWRKEAILNQFIVWDHDRVPESTREPLLKLDSWIELADAIHGE